MHPDLREGQGFSFLFRTDQGRIDRATWWRGTIPLAAIAALATLGWLAVRPYTHDALHQSPPLAVLGYVYLLTFSFATLILLVCEYNLSAKRFTARGKPRVLAAALPVSLLLAGTLDWYVPRSQGALPAQSMVFVMLMVAAVVLWHLVELGLRTDA